MPMLADSVRSLSSMLIIAAILIAGLHYGQDVLVPLAISIILAFILAPLMRALSRAGVPDALAAALVVIAAVSVIAAGLFAFSSQLLALADNLDQYKVNILAKVRWLLESSSGDSALTRAAESIGRLQEDLIREIGGDAAAATQAAGGADTSTGAAAAQNAAAAPDATASGLRDAALALAAPAGKGLLALLLTLFLLLQHADLRDRILRVAGTDNLSNTTAAMEEAGTRLSTLFLAQAMLNTAFGVFVGVALWMIGVPNAVLWGITAGVMRFVPFIGSLLAAVPPLLLAAGMAPDWSMFVWTLLLFAIGEPVMGHLLEPLILGKRSGLTPFAIIVALSLWTLIWGPIGLLVGVPITLAIVVLGRYVPGLEFLSILLGDEPALTPQQRLYNRLLSKDASAAINQIEAAREAMPITATADEIVLPALQLASLDYAMDRLEDRQMESMRTTMDLVTEAFKDAGGMEHMAAQSKESTSLLVVPARGPIDQLAANYIAALLNTLTPYRARASTASGLTALSDAKATHGPDDTKPHIVIASMGASDGGQLKLIVNRAASHFPDNPILIVGAGGADGAPAHKLAGTWMKLAQLVELVSSRTFLDRGAPVARATGKPEARAPSAAAIA